MVTVIGAIPELIFVYRQSSASLILFFN